MFRFAILAILAIAALYALHRVLVWMEEKGWVYYRNGSGRGNIGNAMMPVQAIFQPEVRYVLEERVRNQSEAEQDESGDPPNPFDDELDENEEGQNQ